MNKEIKNADIEKITVDYATKVRETEEEFIFQTITPFCCNILLKIISKKELKDTLLRGEQMKWIPCSERLPKKPEIDGDSDCYIVQTRHVAQPFIGYWDGREWTDEEVDVVDEVIAWMPLPEPYKESDYETD